MALWPTWKLHPTAYHKTLLSLIFLKADYLIERSTFVFLKKEFQPGKERNLGIRPNVEGNYKLLAKPKGLKYRAKEKKPKE